MYAWMWRHLPGPTPLRAALAIAIVTAIVAGLFLFGFPALDRWLGLNDVAVR